MANYSKCTQSEFIKTYEDFIETLSIGEISTVPGVFELLSEYYNNDILDLWSENQAMIKEE